MDWYSQLLADWENRWCAWNVVQNRIPRHLTCMFLVFECSYYNLHVGLVLPWQQLSLKTFIWDSCTLFEFDSSSIGKENAGRQAGERKVTVWLDFVGKHLYSVVWNTSKMNIYYLIFKKLEWDLRGNWNWLLIAGEQRLLSSFLF